MADRFRVFSIVFVTCCLITGGTALADLVNTLPAGLADSNQTVDITLDQAWTGTISGYLNGASVDWYTGYAFHFNSKGITYDEQNSFCVDPADALTGQQMNGYYIESLGSVNALSSDYSTRYKEADIFYMPEPSTLFLVGFGLVWLVGYKFIKGAKH